MTTSHTTSDPILHALRQRRAELVSKCDVIVSAPQTLEWSPPYAVGYGGLGITSKLGVRLFVGLEEPPSDDGKGPRLGTVRHFQPGNVEEPFAELSPDVFDKLSEQICHVLRTHDSGKFCRNIIIHILSEFPFFRGLHGEAALGAALATAIYVYSNKVETVIELQQLIDETYKTPTQELIDDQQFRAVFRLAWELERVTTKYRPEGHHLFASFVKSSQPVLFWRARSTSAPENPENPFDLHPGGCRLGEALAPDGTDQLSERFDPTASMDAALIFLGREVDSLLVFQNRMDQLTRDMTNRYMSAMDGIRRMFTNASLEKPKFALLDPGTQDTQSSANDMLQAHASDLLVVQSVRTFEALRKVVDSGIGHYSVREFIMQVDRAQDLYRLFELSSGYVDEPIHVLRSHGRRLLRQKVGVRLIGPGKAGCVLMLAARGSLKHALATLVKKTQEVVNPDETGTVHCHWFSARDGYSPCGDALRIEMDTDTRIFGLADDGKAPYVLRVWDQGTTIPNRIIDHHEWLDIRHSYDLAFDVEKKELWTGMSPIGELGNVADQTRLLLEMLLRSDACTVDGDAVQNELNRMSREKKNFSEGYTLTQIIKAMKPLSDREDLKAHFSFDVEPTSPDVKKETVGETRFTLRLVTNKRMAMLRRRGKSRLRYAAPSAE